MKLDFWTIDGLRIRYAAARNPGKPQVILTSPQPMSILTYRAWWDRLAERFDLVAVDLPNHGGSDAAQHVTTVSQHADFLGKTGLPTAMTSLLDPATYEVLPHTHSHGYWAMVVTGRMQHWQLSEPDRGPELLPGSYWFQPGGIPHAEDCLGPEICQVFVVFDAAADFTPVQ